MKIPIYQIDSGVPAPPNTKGICLGKLEVGESSRVPLKDRNKVQSFARESVQT